jgi:hypothetical protein
MSVAHSTKGKAMSLPAEVEPLVRRFASNGFRYLFRQADNVADLVRWRNLNQTSTPASAPAAT